MIEQKMKTLTLMCEGEHTEAEETEATPSFLVSGELETFSQ